MLSAGATVRSAVVDNGVKRMFVFQYQQNISADSIAYRLSGEHVTGGAHNGTTVTSATCDENTVQLWNNGITHAECNVALSDGALFRSAVTDNGFINSFKLQYQENS
jgi:hypothetical protein